MAKNLPIRSTETSVDIRNTGRHIPEYGDIHMYCCENLKFYKVSFVPLSFIRKFITKSICHCYYRRLLAREEFLVPCNKALFFSICWPLTLLLYAILRFFSKVRLNASTCLTLSNHGIRSK
jgi:hypothetical protein